MNNKQILDTMDTVNNIEDGLQALRMIATTEQGTDTTPEEFTNAYNYVSMKVLDDLQTVRAALTLALGDDLDEQAGA